LLYRTDNKIDNEYYLFYYQFVKWAFGFKSSNPLKDKELLIRFYFDKLPNSNRRGKRQLLKKNYIKSFFTFLSFESTENTTFLFWHKNI